MNLSLELLLASVVIIRIVVFRIITINGFLIILFLGLLIDLMMGTFLGQTALYFWLVTILLTIHEKMLGIKLRVRILLACIFVGIYFYVSRRYFF